MKKVFISKFNSAFIIINKEGKTNHWSRKYAFDNLQEGDYILWKDGEINVVIDPGKMGMGFSFAPGTGKWRTVTVEEVEFNELPSEIQNAIHYLASSYPSSNICRKVVQQG